MPASGQEAADHGLLASIDELAAKTPATRDRYVDFLRAFSITVVVIGHWTIALIIWENGRISIRNAIGVTRGLWLATWLLQVMPLFFFVGGFSNRVSYEAAQRRGESYRDFLGSRMSRLLKPTAVFGAVWLVIEIALNVFDVGSPIALRGLIRLTLIPFGPLWFLLVYIFVTALTPLTLRLHDKFAASVPVALVALVALVDIFRFWGGVSKLGWLNLLTVWLLAHQLGYFYREQSEETHRWRYIAMALAGLGGLIALTNLGWVDQSWAVYPRSMLGTDVEVISNMSPPTLCIVGLTFWLVGVAMLLRAPIRRRLTRPAVWRAVIAANSVIMTAFLWHLTAYLVVIVVFYPLGLGHPTSSTLSWWLQRPFWIVVPSVVLTGLIAAFGRFERPRLRIGDVDSPAHAGELT